MLNQGVAMKLNFAMICRLICLLTILNLCSCKTSTTQETDSQMGLVAVPKGILIYPNAIQLFLKIEQLDDDNYKVNYFLVESVANKDTFYINASGNVKIPFNKRTNFLKGREIFNASNRNRMFNEIGFLQILTPEWVKDNKRFIKINYFNVPTDDQKHTGLGLESGHKVVLNKKFEALRYVPKNFDEKKLYQIEDIDDFDFEGEEL